MLDTITSFASAHYGAAITFVLLFGLFLYGRIRVGYRDSVALINRDFKKVVSRLEAVKAKAEADGVAIERQIANLRVVQAARDAEHKLASDVTEVANFILGNQAPPAIQTTIAPPAVVAPPSNNS